MWGGGVVTLAFLPRPSYDSNGRPRRTTAVAYDVINALRKNWLQKRGRTSFVQEGEIRVYVDGSGPSSLDILHGIHSDNIEALRFLDERQASFRFGSGHEHGVILVTLRGE